MKLLLIVLTSICTLFFYNYIFDNATLGLIVILFSYLYLKKDFKVDKKFNEFIKVLCNMEFSNLEEAVEEFKEEKKYLKKVFDDENEKVINQFNMLKYTRKELDRFADIQSKKNLFIESQLKKRTKAYAISCIAYILSFIPLLLVKYRNPYFFYKLYNGGYYLIFLLSIIFIAINNLNLKYSNRKNKEDLLFYNDYSVCYHKNCLEILGIEDDRLEFDNKGNAKEIEYKAVEKKISQFAYIPFISSIIVSLALYFI